MFPRLWSPLKAITHKTLCLIRYVLCVPGICQTFSQHNVFVTVLALKSEMPRSLAGGYLACFVSCVHAVVVGVFCREVGHCVLRHFQKTYTIKVPNCDCDFLILSLALVLCDFVLHATRKSATWVCPLCLGFPRMMFCVVVGFGVDGMSQVKYQPLTAIMERFQG